MPQRRKRARPRAQEGIFISRTQRQHSPAERFVDMSMSFFGTKTFFMFHVVVFVFWIVWNVGYIPALAPIDPFPFNFLTTTVSLEAIFLSLFVLINQKRAARIGEVREEMDLQLNVQSEREVTKILEMLASMEKRLHMRQKIDPELLEMLRKIDLDELERRVIRAIERVEK